MQVISYLSGRLKKPELYLKRQNLTFLPILLATFDFFEQPRSSLRGFFSSSNSAIKSEAVLRRPTTKDVLAKKVHLLQTTKKSH